MELPKLITKVSLAVRWSVHAARMLTQGPKISCFFYGIAFRDRTLWGEMSDGGSSSYSKNCALKEMVAIALDVEFTYAIIRLSLLKGTNAVGKLQLESTMVVEAMLEDDDVLAVEVSGRYTRVEDYDNGPLAEAESLP
ncbi:hypothetical protein BHE74_00012953 [Ensete ventricosum]|nr:hypothetical protein GW17_00033763 [Ensete ventricosum]RWW78791.1 hypothetical protein BHE74_00012953 [Ensete ventricosum]RZR80345.1 hypothetical protein BHM03_00006371 [Ensete ventricosum]